MSKRIVADVDRTDTDDDRLGMRLHASEVEVQAQERIWWIAGVLYKRRWWIFGLTFLMAGASVVLSLQLPNKFRAETRVLLPEGGDGLLMGALSNYFRRRGRLYAVPRNPEEPRNLYVCSRALRPCFGI